MKIQKTEKWLLLIVSTVSITFGVIFWFTSESHAVRKEVAFLRQEQLDPSDAKASLLRLARLNRENAITAVEKAWQEHPGEYPNPPRFRLGLILKWLKAGKTAEDIEKGFQIHEQLNRGDSKL